MLTARHWAQDPEWEMVQEDQAIVANGQEVEEDLEHLEFWRRRKLSINQMDLSELSIFPFLSPHQAEQFILYRRLLGNFIDLMELQAVPGWDAEAIRKIIPYVMVMDAAFMKGALLKSINNGEHQLIIRTSLKEGTGILTRYQFTSPHIQGGFQMEKDAGEKFWQGAKGISFLSGQVSLAKLGVFRQVVIGDFNINMAQGLLLGLGRVVRKSGMPMMIKRQQPFLSPYRSTDENRYFRGIGCWLTDSNWEFGGFGSLNHLDGNLRTDSLLGYYITALQTSGIHETVAALEDKNSLGLRSFGLMGAYTFKNVKIGIQGVRHMFSLPIIRSGDLSNKYAISGKGTGGLGFFAETSFRNWHLFGEMSRSNKGQLASLVGMQVAADRRLDFSLLYRSIARAYRAFWSSSFTESTEPADEKGVYIGVCFRPSNRLQIDAYADVYSSAWVKYQINAPVSGVDQLLMVQVKPDKSTLFYIRYKYEQKTDGKSREYQVIQRIGERRVSSVRAHIERKLSGAWTWRSRAEWGWQSLIEGIHARGAVVYTEWFWKPMKNRKSISINGRILFCETDSFDSRVYAYENDISYYGLVAAFYGKYLRFSGNFRLDLYKQLRIELKFAQNFANMHKGTVVRLQLLWRS